MPHVSAEIPANTERGNAALNEVSGTRYCLLFVSTLISFHSPPLLVMSGFEVVGVVLGSIPILIGALERYRDGVRAQEG